MDAQVMEQTATPLPKLQLALTLLIQSTEPIAATVIYPFIPEFVKSTGITKGDETKTGYYAGVIESCFFVSEALVCVYWGRASDVVGRRPVLLLGPLGLTLAMLGFGLSKTFWSLVLFRCFQGTFDGNIGVGRTLMMEITDSTNRADALTYIPIMWSLGITVGPMVGGLLADPAQRWPNVAGKLALLREYPYFLPCAAAALYSFVVFVAGYLGLKETLPSIVNSKKDRRNLEETESLFSTSTPQTSQCAGAEHVINPSDTSMIEDTSTSASGPSPNSKTPLIRPGSQGRRYGSPASDTSVSSSDNSPAPSPSATNSTTPPYSEIFTPRLRIVLINYCFLNFTDMCYCVLIPLVYSTSTSPFGGLGFPPHTIGLIMGTFSLVNAFVQMFGLTKVLKKIGPRRMYQIAYASLFFDFLGLWLVRVMVKWEGGKVTGAVWAVLMVQLGFACLINTAFNATSLLVVESAHPRALGVVNGTAQMMACITRGLAPMTASSLFSLSLGKNIAGGYLVDFVLMGVVVVGIGCSLRLHK
ncbi:MFS general substrate transporter [Dendrothele bispora CBS 962.96]|uniref:MFS general substrate transporter n=1 Tax=Dendrothele bispora (strain CBS 962.96) TaxID=1314807 RepID=A0A4S8LKM3_DENBC|nr:MFS general substrate transporter [Dendrothele bispora CBS 962.96]